MRKLYCLISFFLFFLLAFPSCSRKDKAFVKSAACLKVYISPTKASRSFACLRNFTEVEVLGVERAGVIVKGQKGNFVIISFFDDEGNKRIGYAFDDKLYYPGMSRRATMILTMAITFLVSIIGMSVFFLIRRKLVSLKEKKKTGIKKIPPKKKNKKKEGRISKRIIIIISSLFTVLALSVVLLVIDSDIYVNTSFFSHRLDTTDIDIKQKELRKYVKQYVRAMDYRKPFTRDFAAKIAAQYPGKFNIQQICFIYDQARNNWKYVSDPEGAEYVSPASRTIKNGFIGDCDDFAVLLATLIKAIGGQTRVIYAIGKKNTHAYAEVKININEKTIEYMNKHYRNVLEKIMDINRIEKLHAHQGINGQWLNLDWSSRIPGGKYFKSDYNIIIYPDGYFVEKKFLRE